MPDGSLEPVRCGASNRCDYCAMFAALEAALVLKLDAQISQPTVGLTTTTHDPRFTLGDLMEAERRLWRALRTGRRIGARGPRRRDEPRYEPFPDLRYVGFLEWTTGRGTRSGGHRRPHVHHLTKGIPPDHPLLEEIVVERNGRPETTNRLELRVAELWRAATGGDAWVVECRPLRTPAGAIAYLALHHHKRVQAPPAGFTGRRLRPSRESRDRCTGTVRRRGYYERPIADLRELARRLAAHERIVIATRRAIDAELYGADEADVDGQLTRALVDALRSMATSPLEAQIDLEGNVDVDERAELLRRSVDELERIRQEEPAELVWVIERDEVDVDTGVTVRRAVCVTGPVDPARRAA